MGGSLDTDDPVLRRRESIRHWCAMGKRVGYLALLVAIGAFVAGATRGFHDVTVQLIVIALSVCTIALVPSIIFAYGVKAADREDRRRSS